MNRKDWELLNGHKAGVFWFTGLSGSGKSTLAQQAEKELFKQGIRCAVIDGDQLRKGLNIDLGFSEEDRKENMRRAAEVASMFLDLGFIVLVPMISPSSAAREAIRYRFQSGEFAEIYVQCSLETCEQRDPKGLYKKARKGEIREFTGIDAIYEAPEHAELTVNTEIYDMESSLNLLVDFVTHNYAKKI
ncbi:adenylyl-sulfate kinase [Paenibacillus odorifer]|uniref:adenylyl-sulfate kinase n=1 Tax=Paenibacillus odorifer TaxID=189426 RepID=UPI00096C97E0|nr:adenylyl-sulfate kinase [Paenibacillus odorifer]OME60608.1 adenylyl-sulfate kinase [Paenibacillus odorifer]